MPEVEEFVLDSPPGTPLSWPPDEVFSRLPVGETANQVASAFALGGPVSCVSTACSSSAHALGLALDWLRSGRVDRVLAGGADALCRLTLAGFNSLGVVAADQPRPFDRRRTGMVLGEGGAFLVLEREEGARARGAPVWARLLGYGSAAEAFHIVHPRDDGQGAALAMVRALQDAGVLPQQVDYINAHGTGTLANDAMETLALTRVFGERIPSGALPVSSTKSLVGHTLGASGAVEAVACVLGIREGFLPPTGGFEEADPLCCLDPIAGQARPTRPTCILSNSFAFGGNDASLVLASPEFHA